MGACAAQDDPDAAGQAAQAHAASQAPGRSPQEGERGSTLSGMPRDQAWFEFRDRRKASYQRAPWVPLRASELHVTGVSGQTGFEEEYFGVGSALYPTAARDEALNQQWTDLAHNATARGYVHQGVYVPSDQRPLDDPAVPGHIIPLVLEAEQIGSWPAEWHLHQDFTLTLQLRRDGDRWVAPREGYREAARLLRDADGAPARLDVAQEFLLDYLTARDMGLRLVTFHQRQEIQATDPQFTWTGTRWAEESSSEDSFDGWITEIHAGTGFGFGERMFVSHVARTDVDATDEVPILGPPTEENTVITTGTRAVGGARAYRINSERYRNEWIDPKGVSHRVRHDPEPQHVQFPVDATGLTQPLKKYGDGYWLWFRPSLIPAVLALRDSRLRWYTRDTGALVPSPDHGLHFGVNTLGLINVYGKDVAKLPNWLQQIFAAHAVRPDGGVSAELLASQVHTRPAETVAPEDLLVLAVRELNDEATLVWGQPVMRLTDTTRDLLNTCHRFRVQAPSDLYVLAKDVTRAILESMDLDLLLKHGPPLKKGESKPGTRTALQRAVATQIGEAEARTLMGPLAGVYDLRLNDAHHAQEKIDSGLKLLGIQPDWPLVRQGEQLLLQTAVTVHRVAVLMESWRLPGPATPPDSAPEG